MIDNMNKNVFEEILSPIQTSMEEAQNSIHGDSKKYKLSLSNFAMNLFYGIICQIKSISLMVTDNSWTENIEISPKVIDLAPKQKQIFNVKVKPKSLSKRPGCKTIISVLKIPRNNSPKARCTST